MAGELLTFSPTIDLGQLATIGVALVGGLWFAVRALASVKGIKADLVRFEERLGQQAEELKKIADILTAQGKHDVRLAYVEAELARLRERA